MITVLELGAAEGITLGFTLDTVGRTSEICGTLNPSKRVDQVWCLTLVVTIGALDFERHERAVEGPDTSDRTWARPRSESSCSGRSLS